MNRTSTAVHSLKLGATAQTLRLFAGYGANLLTTPYVVHRLGVADFGIWSMTGAFAQSAVMLDLGVSRANDRYVALFHTRGDHAAERSAAGVCMTVLAVLGCVLFAVSVLAPSAFESLLHTGDPTLVTLLLVSAVTMLICGMFARALAGGSFGRGRQVWSNVGLAALGVAQAMGGVIALIVTPTLASFAIGTAVGSVVGLAAVIGAILVDEGRIVIGRPTLALGREMLSYGVVGQVRGIADIVMIQSPKLIAGVLLGPAAAGVYELGSRLVQGAVTFGSAASEALFVHLTRGFAANGQEGIVEQYPRLAMRNAAVTLFVPLFLCATSFSLVPLWLNERHFDVILVLVVLATATTVRMAGNVCVTAFLAMGRPGVVGAVMMASAAVTVLFAIVLARAFGFAGIIAAFGICIATGGVLAVWILQMRMGVPFLDFYLAVRGPFTVGLLATCAAIPVGIISAPDDRRSALIPFVVSAVVFSTVYAVIGRRRDYLPSFRKGWQ